MKKIYPAILKRNSSGDEIRFPNVAEVIAEVELGVLAEKSIILPTPSLINNLSTNFDDSKKSCNTNFCWSERLLEGYKA